MVSLFESSTCFEQLCAHLLEDICIKTTVLLRMNSKHVEDSNKLITEEIVRQGDYLPELCTPLSSLYFVILKRIIRVIPENLIVAKQATKFLAFEGIESFITVFTNISTLVLIFIHANPAHTLTHSQERPFLILLTCAHFFQLISPFWFSDCNYVCVSIAMAPNILRTRTKLARVKDRQNGLKNDMLK
jgi:hypothetical protein